MAEDPSELTAGALLPSSPKEAVCMYHTPYRTPPHCALHCTVAVVP
jgi:hypothetical protein